MVKLSNQFKVICGFNTFEWKKRPSTDTGQTTGNLESLAAQADIKCTSSRILLTLKFLKLRPKVRDLMREEGEDGSQARPRKAGGRKANGGTTTVV